MRIAPAGVLLALTALTAPAVANGPYDIDRLAYFEAGNSAEVEVDGNHLFAGIGRHLLILDVSDPTKPTKIASTVAAGPANITRDIQVSGNHVFVTLGDYGLRIYDVSDPGNPTLAGTLDGVELWDFDIAGSTLIASSSSKTLQSVDISDFSNPSPISTATLSTYTSGAVIQGDYAFVPGSISGVMMIVDVSDPANIGVIGSINLSLPPIFSHAAHYAHQGWLSPDRQYVYFNDEVDEAETGNPTTTRVIDISDLSNPTQVAIFTNGNTARDHNLYTKGELIFESNYRSGLRVFSAGDPLAPAEIAYFDTYPADDNANYNGLWSVYPYLPSGTIIGSDIEKGLFVWSFAAEPVPALSARNSLAMAAMIAVMTMVTLRSRRFRGRTLPATIAALLAVGLGCGSQESADSVATTVTDSKTAPDHPIPATGKAHVEYVDGLVTVQSNGSLQIAVLEQLAAQAGFAIAAGRIDAQPITLQIERVALIDAIELILDGLTYTVEYDLDEASGTRFLALVAIGDAIGYGAADSAAQGDARRDPIGRAHEAPSEEQAEILLELDNPDPETRADAVFWIDLEGDALERLISMLQSDPDAEVRASVVDRLGEEESAAATAAVAAALRARDPEVVFRAIEVLEFDAGDWLIPELERLLAHPDQDVREAAEDAILYLK